MGTADLHIHSSASDGMMTVPELLDYVQNKTDLDVIAVTDHDEIGGSLEARDLVSGGKYRFELVTGMEISTLEGHLLALFIERTVPSNRHIEESIDAVHSMGGLCIATHPMSWLTRSIGEGVLNRIICGGGHAYFDAIEANNGQVAAKVSYRKTQRLNQERYHLPETGGSDAHFLASIGSAITVFPGKTAADVRHSIIEKTCTSLLVERRGLKGIGPWQVMRQLGRGLVVLPARNLGKTLKARSKKARPA